MNKLFIAAAVLATSSLSALAGGLATYEPAQQFTSTVTRAQVRAELARAAANGELAAGEQSYVAPVQGHALSREEVRAQLDSARRTHQLPSGEFAFAAAAPVPLAGR
jgi:hypothetical protein